MTDEEFERIKEAEKERLRSQKRLKEALSTLKRKRKIDSVVGRMSEEARDLLRQGASVLDALRGETARAEARFEVATEADRALGRGDGDDADATGVGDVANGAASDEELEARAEALIRQLRLETRPGRERPGVVQDRTIGRVAPESGGAETSRPAPRVKPTPRTTPAPGARRAAGEANDAQTGTIPTDSTDPTDDAPADDAENLPEKTIGRMQRPGQGDGSSAPAPRKRSA